MSPDLSVVLLARIRRRQCQSWSGMKPTENRNHIYIYYVDDWDAAPPEWKNDDVKKMAAVSTVTAGSVTLRVAVGP